MGDRYLKRRLASAARGPCPMADRGTRVRRPRPLSHSRQGDSRPLSRSRQGGKT